MRRIGVAIIDLICEDVVLILVRRPVIETHFRAKGSGVTAHIVRTEEIGGITLFCERMFLVHPQERIQVIVLVVDGWVTQFTVMIPTENIAAGAGESVAESDAIVSDSESSKSSRYRQTPSWFSPSTRFEDRSRTSPIVSTGRSSARVGQGMSRLNIIASKNDRDLLKSPHPF